MSADLDFTLSGLLEAGFKLHAGAGKDVTYRAEVSVRDMPYMSKVVDDQFIFEDSVMTVDFWPEGKVGQFIAATHYREEPISTKTDEGLAVLRDALEGLAKMARSARKASTARI